LWTAAPSKLVSKLGEHGHEAVAASPDSEGSSLPYSIVHATQFFEFMKSIAEAATDGNTVRS
jgi:hypothetical protein